MQSTYPSQDHLPFVRFFERERESVTSDGISFDGDRLGGSNNLLFGRGTDDALDVHLCKRCSRVPGLVDVVVIDPGWQDLVVFSLEERHGLLRLDQDLLEIFHGSCTDKAGHDDSKRKSVVARQWFSVHLVSENDVPCRIPMCIEVRNNTKCWLIVTQTIGEMMRTMCQIMK